MKNIEPLGDPVAISEEARPNQTIDSTTTTTFPTPPQPIPQDINSQWQTKQEYTNSQQFSQPTLSSDRYSKFVRIFAYALGISIFIMILAGSTPLGEIFSSSIIDSRSHQVVRSNPISAIALVVAVLSYLGLLIATAVKRAHAKQSKGGIITMMVLSVILLFNPFSALILLMTIQCNLSPCQSS
jgi:hypothetical protein